MKKLIRRTGLASGLAIVMMLCILFGGCGKDRVPREGNGDGVPTATSTATPTATPSPTPTPERAPKEFSFKELYTPVENYDYMYNLGFNEYTDGYNISIVETAGGFVFMVGSPYDEESESTDYSKTTLFLVHLGRPDLFRTHSDEESEYRSWKLLPDGTVISYETGIDAVTKIQVYDRELTPQRAFSVEGMVCSCSDDGRVWTNNIEQKTMRGYDLASGEKVFEYTFDDIVSVASFLKKEDNRWTFAGTNPGMESFLVVVDGDTGTVSVVKAKHEKPRFETGCIIYDSENNWFVSPYTDDDLLLRFPKLEKSEYLLGTDGMCVATFAGHYNVDDPDDERYHQTLRIYDAQNGAKYPDLSLDGLPKYSYISGREFVNGGVFFYGHNSGGLDCYVYDYTATKTEELANYSRIDGKNIDSYLANLIDSIRDRFGIEMYYKEVDLKTEIFDYIMWPIEDEISLLNITETMYAFLATYPDNFWRELTGKEMTGVNLYVCEHFERTGDYMIGEAAAVVNKWEDKICMAACTRYESTLLQTLAHETMHMMEYRIEEYFESENLEGLSYWLYALNTEKYPYFYAYTDDNGNNLTDPAGTYGWGDDSEDVWYIDAYSKSNYREDRARVIENLYARNLYYFRSSRHLQDKAEFLCATIRAAFPCVAASETPAPWETLGIFDPAPYMEKVRIYGGT